MGACEFVMRLLARVTGEKSESMYVWHRCWLVPFLKKEKIERKDFQDRTRKLNKNSVGPGIKKFMQLFPKNWGVVVSPPPECSWIVGFQQNRVSAMMSRVDTALKTLRRACHALSSQLQRGERWRPFRTVRYAG